MMRNMLKQGRYFTAISLMVVSSAYAGTISTEISSTDDISLGQISFEDTSYGLLITPHLSGLPMGAHGFHIHQTPDCGDKGMKAGGHLDPDNTNSHQGPYGAGHLGDLPILVVNSQGVADIPVLAPRLKIKDIQGHALMIHAGGDNYTDIPALGGGGSRIGCGKIAP